jgi:hypothetical protein
MMSNPNSDHGSAGLITWVGAMPIAERLTVLHAMSFAFPILKNDRDWTTKVSAVLVELKPTKRQHEDILIAAARMSGRLKRKLAG